uniref:Cytochrome c oxidase subunit 6B2 n=1 Tax=Bos taurus TaxID=9913 RepID=A0AAF6YQK9_BOVIN
CFLGWDPPDSTARATPDGATGTADPATRRRSAERRTDYHRCIKTMNRRGKSTQPCEYYFRVYHSLCPISWVQRWKEQIKDGTFAGKI